jgi:hypothetical protein
LVRCLRDFGVLGFDVGLVSVLFGTVPGGKQYEDDEENNDENHDECGCVGVVSAPVKTERRLVLMDLCWQAGFTWRENPAFSPAATSWLTLVSGVASPATLRRAKT